MKDVFLAYITRDSRSLVHALSQLGFVLGNKMLAAEVFAKNGFLVLSSDTGEEKISEVNADHIDQGKSGDDTQKGVLLTRA